MFPMMNDNVRQMFRNNLEMTSKMTEQALDLQVEAAKIAHTQINKNVDAYNTAVETSAKATRSMYKAWIDGVMAQLEAPAAA